MIDNNNKRGDCERYIAEPCSPAVPFSDPPSAATFTFFQSALSIPSDSSDPMDSMPVSFPSLLTMDLITAPRPASPTESVTDSSDSDYSPPQTPVDLEPISFLTHEDINFGDKLPPPLLKTRNLSHDNHLDTCSAPPDDELFAPPPPAFPIPPGLNATSAAWLAMLFRREAYLYPSRVAETTVCVYDPSWHEDSLRGYPLPLVTVTGCAEDAEQWFENAAECDEGPCWDHLMAPMITNNGRMSQEDEELYYPYPMPETSFEYEYVCDDDDVEEPEVPECTAYEARWRGASLQELEDELAKQKVLVEMQRIGADGIFTYVPQRVEGRRWLWKNFWCVAISSDLPANDADCKFRRPPFRLSNTLICI